MSTFSIRPLSFAVVLLFTAGGTVHAAPIVVDDFSSGFDMETVQQTGVVTVDGPVTVVSDAERTVSVNTPNAAPGLGVTIAEPDAEQLLSYFTSASTASELRLLYDFNGNGMDISGLTGISLDFHALSAGTGQTELPVWFELTDSDDSTIEYTAMVAESIDPFTLLVDFDDFTGDTASFDFAALDAFRVRLNTDFQVSAGAILRGGEGGGLTFIPEPASLALLGVGGLVLLRRRRAA